MNIFRPHPFQFCGHIILFENVPAYREHVRLGCTMANSMKQELFSHVSFNYEEAVWAEYLPKIIKYNITITNIAPEKCIVISVLLHFERFDAVFF